MATYRSIENATLATVLAKLESEKIDKERIVNIYYDGSSHIAVYRV